MRLTQIEEFIAVADHGSIRAAARILGCSQPAMTKSLKALEGEFGVALVHRNARGIELTGSGRLFLTRARIITRELERSRHELAHSGMSKTVSIAAAPGIAAVVLPTALKRLRRELPEVEVRVLGGMPPATLPLLRDGTVDFALGPILQEPVAADLIATHLISVEIAIVVRRGHPLTKTRSLSALVDHDWITAGQGRDSIVVDEMFRSAQLSPPRWVVRCESIPALIAIVARTDFIATIPKLLIEIGLGGNLLEIIKIREKLAVSNVCLFTKRESPLTPAAQRLVSLVKAVARNAKSPNW